MAVLGKNFNTILVKTRGHRVRYKVDAAVLPGQRVAVAADGNVDPVGTAGLLGRRLIAVENDMEGKTVLDTYDIGEEAQFIEVQSGDEVQLHLKASMTIVIGDKLIVTTDGSYIKTTGTPAQTDFEARESITTGASDTALIHAVAI